MGTQQELVEVTVFLSDWTQMAFKFNKADEETWMAQYDFYHDKLVSGEMIAPSRVILSDVGKIAGRTKEPARVTSVRVWDMQTGVNILYAFDADDIPADMEE